MRNFPPCKWFHWVTRATIRPGWDLRIHSSQGSFMRCFAVLFAALIAFSSFQNSIAAPATKEHPNIIMVLSDDVGLGDIHCTGGSFSTPNIDKLAAGGTKFTYSYATPLCGPSRCELLTGRYPFRTGLNSNQSKDAVNPKSEVMIPTVLKKRRGMLRAASASGGRFASAPANGVSTSTWYFPAAAGTGAIKPRPIA